MPRIVFYLAEREKELMKKFDELASKTKSSRSNAIMSLIHNHVLEVEKCQKIN